MRTEGANGKGARSGDTRTDTGDSEMYGKVLDTRCAIHSDEDDESNGGDTHASDDKGSSNASAIRKNGDSEACQEA
jgi:hypothetical protein